MKRFLLLACFLYCSFAMAGNGSSGVGNSPIGLLNTVESSDLVGSVSLKGNLIVSTKTSEVLLKILSIESAEVKRLQKNGVLVPAQLGSFSALEKLKTNKLPDSYWIICDASACKKIVPVSVENPLAVGVMGTLREKSKP